MGMLEGYTALVAGGGSGIGRAIAQRLHEEGAYLFISGRREEKLREACSLISPSGERIVGVPADATDVQDIARLAQTVQAQRGGLDVLVNCMGIMRFGKLETWSPARCGRCSTSTPSHPGSSPWRCSRSCAGATRDPS